MDKITVILPVYKVEQYINQCMDSVLNQTYTNLEIILVDDGSPDNCGKICDEYAQKDSRVKVIHKINEGAPAARNDALAIATGEWISYVDPDDWIELDEFEELMKVAQRDDPDIVIFNTYVNKGNTQIEQQAFPEDFTTEEKSFISKLQLSSLDKSYNPYLQNWSQGFPWDKIFKKSFLQEHNILWPTNVKANDDVIYMIHAFQFATKVSYINKTYYHYRSNPESIGHRYMPDRVKIDHDIYVEMIRIRDMYGLGDDYMAALNARIIRNTWLCLGRCFFHPDNKKPFSEKMKDISSMLNDDIIKTAFHNVDHSKLNKHLNLMVLFKNSKPIWIYVVYRAYEFKHNVL